MSIRSSSPTPSPATAPALTFSFSKAQLKNASMIKKMNTVPIGVRMPIGTATSGSVTDLCPGCQGPIRIEVSNWIEIEPRIKDPLMYSDEDVRKEDVIEGLARTPTVLLNCGHRVHETCLCQAVNVKPAGTYSTSPSLEQLWRDHNRWKCFVPGCNVNIRVDGSSVPEVAARDARAKELGIDEAPSVNQTYISIADRVQLQDRINLGLEPGQTRPLGRAMEIRDSPQEIALQARIKASILGESVRPVAPVAPDAPVGPPPSAPAEATIDLNQQVRELQAQRNNLSQQLRDSQNEKRRTEERLNEVEITIETILRDNELQENDLNVTIEALRTEATVLRERIASLASLTTENESLKRRSKLLQEQIKQQKEAESALVREQKETESALKDVINAKESQLSAQRGGMDTLIDSMSRLAREKEDAEARVRETTNALEKLDASNFNLISESEECMEKNMMPRDKIEKLKRDNQGAIPLRFKKLIIRQNLIQPQSRKYSNLELTRASKLIDASWAQVTARTTRADESALGKELLQAVDRLYGDGIDDELEDEVDANGNLIPYFDLPHNSTVASLLIESRAAFVWEKLEPGGETLLEKFARLGWANLIDNLVRGGAFLDVYNERTNRSALMVAAENGSGPFVEQLLLYEVDGLLLKSKEPGVGRAIDLARVWWKNNSVDGEAEPFWLKKLGDYTLAAEQQATAADSEASDEEADVPIGVPMQPGTAEDGAFSNTDNLKMLIPFILVAFHESNSLEAGFMTLCKEVTNLLATNKQLNNPDAWYLVLKEMRMPLITDTTNTSWDGPPLSPTDPKYPKVLFEFYCKHISRWETMHVAYSASIVLRGWQDQIVKSLIPGPAAYERFTKAVTAWVWVANNYIPFKPQAGFFEEFVAALVSKASDTAWEFFVKTVFEGVDYDLDMTNFNTMFIITLLKKRDEQMENGTLGVGNRTFDYVITSMPPDKMASFLVTLIAYKSNEFAKQIQRIPTFSFDEDDVRLFYSRLMVPIMTKIRTISLPSKYTQVQTSIGTKIARYAATEINVSIEFQRHTSLNILLFETRIFLMSAFPSESNFVDNFERFMQDEEDKKTIRNLLQPETTQVEWHPFPWPTSVYNALE